MYNVGKRSTVLENALQLHETRRVYIQSHNKMGALGYVYTLEKETSHSPERCTSRNTTSTEFLEVKTPQCVCMTGICRCPVSSARSTQKFDGKNKKNKKKNVKR